MMGSPLSSCASVSASSCVGTTESTSSKPMDTRLAKRRSSVGRLSGSGALMAMAPSLTPFASRNGRCSISCGSQSLHSTAPSPLVHRFLWSRPFFTSFRQNVFAWSILDVMSLKRPAFRGMMRSGSSSTPPAPPAAPPAPPAPPSSTVAASRSASASSAAGLAPCSRSLAMLLPFTNARNVGNALTPRVAVSICASSLPFWSPSSRAKTTRPAYRAASSATLGAMRRQGPHHVA
mmetsp:Transcript_8254/g.29315  ORF Transcript_8254/g.29315 Transcript_8254/m.29315 type:complete len:234 (-) Transcript_8254:217-918(-)